MRRGLFFCVLVTIGGLVAGCGSPPAADEGVLRVALSREPATWNRLLAADYPTHVVTDQLHAPLIRLNQETQLMEPALAESWEFSEDGGELVFYLRDGVRFSDGEPFTADDVSFTFRVLHDPGVASQLKDSAVIDGENIVAHVIDETTVGFRLPRRTATVERIFDSIRSSPSIVWRRASPPTRSPPIPDSVRPSRTSSVSERSVCASTFPASVSSSRKTRITFDRATTCTRDCRE